MHGMGEPEIAVDVNVNELTRTRILAACTGFGASITAPFWTPGSASLGGSSFTCRLAELKLELFPLPVARLTTRTNLAA